MAMRHLNIQYKVNNANRDRELELLKNGIILTATAGSVSSAQRNPLH